MATVTANTVETSGKTPKAQNYTPEQTKELIAAYKAAENEESRDQVISTFAEKFGKGVRSIVAKLSREEVYIKKQYVSKTGAAPQKKDSMADAIGAVLRLTEAETESLTKANKTALDKIFKALANSKPIDSFEDNDAEKAEYADSVAAMLQLEETDAKSLMRTTKNALGRLFTSLQQNRA